MSGSERCAGDCGAACSIEDVTPRRKGQRNIVTRADGRLVNVNRQLGQLFVCAHGCCCGREAEGKPPGHFERYHEEWERRKLRNKVHLNMGGCLGPCPLANVCMLLFDGVTVFFHSMNSERLIGQLFDYIEALVAAGRYVPPDGELGRLAFSAMANDGRGRPAGAREEAADVPAPRDDRGILVLSHSDTDVLCFTAAARELGGDFPPVTVRNIAGLRDTEDAAALFDQLVPRAAVTVLVVHGGRRSVPAVERLAELADEHGGWLIAVPGTEELDEGLIGLSTAGAGMALAVRAYLQEGGVANYRECLKMLGDHLLSLGVGYRDPAPQPRTGFYHPRFATREAWRAARDARRPAVGVLFYRSFFLSGDTAFIDALVEAGEALGADVLPVFGYSLKDDPDGSGRTAVLRELCDAGGQPEVDAVVNTMAFALGSAGQEPGASEWQVNVLEELGLPQVQGLTISTSVAQWEGSVTGAGPLDVAMSVAIPELDGRIIGVPASFKERGGDGTVRRVLPRDRAERLMGLAVRLARLRRTPNAEKRVAIILTNHHAKASRIANAVGLDSPESVVRLLRALRDAGYTVGPIPEGGDALMQELLARGHYEEETLTEAMLAGAAARVPAERYRAWFEELPARRQAEMAERWGPPPGRHYLDAAGNLVVAGIVTGNVFLAIQPPRGYSMNRTAIMHQPDLPPPHPYYALYRWLREPQELGGFGADAIVQVGKHGSAEWLPGKGVGLGADCYPDLFVGDLPVVYPFIIDGPGEGAAAKRRTHAVIVDHLPPPITNAELYGELAELDRLVDEYYLLERTDPGRLPYLQRQIWDVIRQAGLANELDRLLQDGGDGHVHEWDPREHEDGVPYALSDLSGEGFAHLVEAIHTYTHELGAAPIRVGLHVLGEVPEGDELVDFAAAMLRVPNGEIPALAEAAAAWLGIPADLLALPAGQRLEGGVHVLPGEAARSAGELQERLAGRGRAALRGVLLEGLDPVAAASLVGPCRGDAGPLPAVLGFALDRLAPALERTVDELGHVVDALDGRYVPPGPAGALTRGMAHALPTGRNFYAVDPRAIPSRVAWEVGQELAAATIERYVRELGVPPRSIGLSMWGTTAMRNGGEDVALVLALIGVEPTWQRESRRVAGFRVRSLDELGRPRVDVVCRVSGFFRDAFPGVIELLGEAFDAVAALDEPPAMNPIRAHRVARATALREAGMEEREAWQRAGVRVFGSAPGVYGAGVLQLLDEAAWEREEEIAETFLAWGGHGYAPGMYGVPMGDELRHRLGLVDAAVQSQDNREHDILDADDYFQFQGGMAAAVRMLRGRGPRLYFGDSSDPRRPRVRLTEDELDRVVRARVLNPKWIAAMREHGYRAGTEFAATVDYLFGWAATAGIVKGWQFERVAERYVLDAEMQRFLGEHNPWALRDMSRRLGEAIRRGLWQAPAGMAARLEAALLEAEGAIEDRM
ncbi:MAG: cobaltochelatase subunit CobN [Tepidiforma sp.]|nr:cobaltochelatase subunit CobN [Tepidiforma sp.]GIW17829.1 MAG: cobaltochelatase subunit CobN [Tepidiforma sp.]